MKFKIQNSKGEDITLTPRELKIAQLAQKKANAVGYNINVPLLTTVIKQVQEQKYFTVRPSEFLPVRVGDAGAAWSTHLLTYRQFDAVDDFSTGFINTASNDARLASASAAIDSVLMPIRNWAKDITYSLPELEHASKTGVFDLIQAKESARKRNWDLGVQRTAFLGAGTGYNGLLNQTGLTTNTSLITKAIKDMTATELSAFVAGLLAAYRANANYTAWPTHFIIPESDYLGLMTPTSSDFPLKSKLEFLLENLRVMTGNPGFKIVPLPYADPSLNTSNGVTTAGAVSGVTAWTYMLYNADEQTLRMDIPVDYTTTQQNSVNGFHWHNVGYGQLTGVQVYRPQEVMYFTRTYTP